MKNSEKAKLIRETMQAKIDAVLAEYTKERIEREVRDKIISSAKSMVITGIGLKRQFDETTIKSGSPLAIKVKEVIDAIIDDFTFPGVQLTDKEKNVIYNLYRKEYKNTLAELALQSARRLAMKDVEDVVNEFEQTEIE
jgi:hypothetical protein